MSTASHMDYSIKGNGIEWLNMVRPSNFHAHLRQSFLMQAISAETMRPWKYLLVMPNTGPIDTIEKMLAYREALIRIRDTAGLKTEFIMTLYLTSALTPLVVEQMAKLDFPCAVKYYPPQQGATTGSGYGIPLAEAQKMGTLATMERCGIRLLGHFESVVDTNRKPLPHEAREDYFMQHEFSSLRESNPYLKITIEHATTARAISRVKEDRSGNTLCSITPQAMLLVRPDLDSLTWGVHAKCMPIAKTPEDRNAVLEFATSGDFRAHLGDDTAAHPSKAKLVPFENAASGCYLPHSPALYLKVFHEQSRLSSFVEFACHNGPDAWGLPRPTMDDRIAFRKSDSVPELTFVPELDDSVVPFGWSKGTDALIPGLVLTS